MPSSFPANYVHCDQKDVPVMVRVKKITDHKADSFAMVIADLIETDIPVQLGPLLFHSTPVPPAKRQYFPRK